MRRLEEQRCPVWRAELLRQPLQPLLPWLQLQSPQRSLRLSPIPIPIPFQIEVARHDVGLPASERQQQRLRPRLQLHLKRRLQRPRLRQPCLWSSGQLQLCGC